MNSSISRTTTALSPPLHAAPGRPGSKSAEVKRPWWKQPMAIFCVALPLLIAAGLLARVGYRSIRERMQVRAARKLQEELFSEAGRQLSEDERRDKFKKLRQTQESLSPRGQSELWAPRQQAMRAEIKRFFEMSPQDQVAFLDKRIKEGEERRKRWEQRRLQGSGGNGGGANGGGGLIAGGGGAAVGGAGGGGVGGVGVGGGGGRTGGGGPGGGGGGWGRGGGAGGGGPGGGGGAGGSAGAGAGGPPGGPGGRGAWNDPARRQTMIKNMLDSTTPEDRAQMSMFFQMMQQRRMQLGLPPRGPR